MRIDCVSDGDLSLSAVSCASVDSRTGGSNTALALDELTSDWAFTEAEVWVSLSTVVPMSSPNWRR